MTGNFEGGEGERGKRKITRFWRYDIGRVLSMNPAEEENTPPLLSRTDQCPTRADTTGEILFFARNEGEEERSVRWFEATMGGGKDRKRKLASNPVNYAKFTTDYERKKAEIYSLFAPLFSFAEDTLRDVLLAGNAWQTSLKRELGNYLLLPPPPPREIIL